jgi:DNA-binding transcriptional ArsR family regulator
VLTLDSNNALQHANLRANASRATALLRTLGHEDRLVILCCLSQGEHCVSEIETITGIAQPMLSQHLTVLRANGCVQTRRASRHIYYTLHDPSVQAVLATLHQCFCAQPDSCASAQVSSPFKPTPILESK